MREELPGVGRAASVLAVGWAVLLGVVVGVGWLLTRPWRSDVDGFDDPVSRWFADQRAGALGHVADVGTLLGETVVGVSLVVVVALAFALVRRTWRPLVLAAVVEAGLGGLYAIATAADPRQRPPVHILDSGLVPDASFPSGHTATATAWALCVVLLVRVYAPRAWPVVLAVLAVPVLTLLSRLYQGAHHLTDVLTSLAYATVWTLLVASVVLPLGPRIPWSHDRRVQHQPHDR